MDNELREQIKVHVTDAMSEGEVNSNLDWHISIFMRVIQQEIAKAENRAISYATNPAGRTELKVRHHYICTVCRCMQDELTLKEHKEQ